MLTGVLLTAAIFLLPRILLIQKTGAESSVDHWYWKSYVEALRFDWKFPPALSKYLLDAGQWYPPLYPIFLALLPKRVFEGYTRYIAAFIDLARLALLMAAIWRLSEGSHWAVFAGGLVYSTTFILITYNTQLNSRGFGAILLDLAALLYLGMMSPEESRWIYISVVLSCALILLMHKMTTQLLWFLCLAAAIVYGDWMLAALIPFSAAMALLISGGFYWKVARAHWDIVAYWNRNWQWLQAHPLMESPIYGDPGYSSPGKFHQRGLAGIYKHLSYLIMYAPGVWLLALPLAAAGCRQLHGNPDLAYIAVWVGVTASFAVITTFVPVMKCLGSGYFYLYNAAFPAALLWGLLAADPKGPGGYYYAGLAMVLMLSAVGYVMYLRRQSRAQAEAEDKLPEVIQYLATAPKGVFFCYPLQMAEIAAYKTHHSVLWGGHGYGFTKLDPIFPRLLKPIREVASEYDLRYFLTIEGWAPQKFIDDLPAEKVLSFGKYRLYLLCKP
ncbi:MAG: hypothetical protein OEV92_00535 [Nitrospinota bacterium]|nr:hypothetical protein [Nitrospinota bacterium]